MYLCVSSRGILKTESPGLGGTMDVEGQWRPRQGVGQAAGWMVAPSGEKRTSMGRTGSGDKFPPGMSLRVYVTSKWMPLRGSCTNGLKAYEQGQGWKWNLGITNKCMVITIKDQLMLLWELKGERLGIRPKRIPVFVYLANIYGLSLSGACVGIGDWSDRHSPSPDGSACQRNRSWSRFCGVWHCLRKGI